MDWKLEVAVEVDEAWAIGGMVGTSWSTMRGKQKDCQGRVELVY